MAAELFRHMESRSQNRGGGADLEEMSSVQLLVAKSHHFAKCSKIEQSLPQIVTRRKKWSTSACSGWPRGLVWWSKSREEPWRAQAASPRQSKSNPIFRGNRVDTIFGAGLAPCSFFAICSSDVVHGFP